MQKSGIKKLYMYVLRCKNRTNPLLPAASTDCLQFFYQRKEIPSPLPATAVAAKCLGLGAFPIRILRREVEVADNVPGLYAVRKLTTKF
jgi:hypothetical protein